MATFNATKLTASRSAVTGGLALKKQTLATQVWVDVSATAADTYVFGKLPKGAVITGGRLFSGRLASGASAACTSVGLCLGVDQILNNASGTSYSVASNTSALGVWAVIDFSIITSNSVFASQRWESGFTSPLGGLLLTQGPMTVMADGNVFATLITAAQSSSGISGYLNLELDYYTGTYS